MAAAAGVLNSVVRTGQLPQCPLLFNLRNCPCASGRRLLATLALPDSDCFSLDGVLSAEGADVARVLSDFHLFDLFSEGGTITGTVFPGHTDLCKVVSEKNLVSDCSD